MAGKTLNVPFVKQKASYCGPASLAMVMQYYGSGITQDVIGDKTLAQHFAVTIGQLEEIAKGEGFETSVKESSLGELVSCIDEGCPVIVAQHRTIEDKSGHYRVVVGYDPESKKIMLHDPDIGSYLDIPEWLFLNLGYVEGIGKTFENPSLILRKKE